MRLFLKSVLVLAGVAICAVPAPKALNIIHTEAEKALTEESGNAIAPAAMDEHASDTNQAHANDDNRPVAKRSEGHGHDGEADPAREPGHAEKDNHDHEANSAAGSGHSEKDGHGHGQDEAAHSEEGVVRMSAGKAAAAQIDVQEAVSGKIARRLTAPGVIVANPDRIARVPVKVVGTVVEMRKRLGEEVAEGEVVAVLDSREVADAKSEYLTAIVNLELQETNFNRAKTLWEKRISAEAQYLQARATYIEAKLRADLGRQKLIALNLDPQSVDESSKKDIAAGESSLRRYEIRSLVGGRVIDRKVEVGSSVGQDSDPKELYTVADLSTVWVELAIPTGSLEDIHEGEPVSIAVSGDTESNERGTGKIVFISPLLDPETRSARVIAEIDNADAVWRPGTYVTASISTEEEPVDIVVPRASIQLIEGKHVVFVRADERFEKREVKIGKSDDDSIEIVQGLKQGDMVAAANTFLLKAELGKSEAEHAH